MVEIEKRSRFVDGVAHYLAELEAAYGGDSAEQELKAKLSRYKDRADFAKQVTLRLPRHLVAQLDVVLKYVPMGSRNTMIVEMIESCILDVADLFEGCPDELVKTALAAVAEFEADPNVDLTKRRYERVSEE